jgi:hypothetical protein
MGVIAAVYFVIGERYAYPVSYFGAQVFLFIGRLTEKTITEPGYFSNEYLKLMTALFTVGLAGALTFSVVAAHLLPQFAPILLGVEV